MRRLLAFALVALVSNPAGGWKLASEPAMVPAGNIYYVSTSGNDSNPGSLSQPWQSIYQSATTVMAGDTVFIRGGTYQESNIFYEDGTQAAPITISGYPGEEVILAGNDYQIPPKGSGGALIEVRGDWVVIRDLTFTQSGQYGITTTGNHDTITNVYSHHNWGWGILMMGNYDITLDSLAWSNSMMNENHVLNSGWAGGVTCARYPDYCTIRNTKSWENWGEGISTFESLHTSLDGNTSFDNQVNIYVSDTKYALVSGNLVYCTPGNKMDPYQQTGILVYEELGVPIPLGSGGTRYASSDNSILNNIIMGCDNNLFATQNQAANNLYAFNTFVNGSGTVPYYTANVHFASGTASNQRFVNNLVYQSDALAILEISAPGIVSFSNNLWSKLPDPDQGASGPGDVIGDPKLSGLGSPYSPDWFKLTDLSPAIDRGTGIQETNVDFFHTIRGALPDIGALEFNPLPTIRIFLPLILGMN